MEPKRLEDLTPMRTPDAGQLEGEREGGDPRAPWKVRRSSVEAHRGGSRSHGH